MGPIDPGEIAAEAATRGTREEAGVIGRLRDPERPLGVWPNMEHRSKTSIFVLDVTQELIEKWEGSDRARKWFSLQEAEEVLQWKPLNIIMLNSLKERLGIFRRQEERRIDNLLAVSRSDAGDVGEEEEGDEDASEVLKSNGYLARSGDPTTTTTTTTAPAPTTAPSAPLRSIKVDNEVEDDDAVGGDNRPDEEGHLRLLQAEGLAEKDSAIVPNQPAIVYLRAGSENPSQPARQGEDGHADAPRQRDHGDPTSYP